jgi:hypothetical protein
VHKDKGTRKLKTREKPKGYRANKKKPISEQEKRKRNGKEGKVGKQEISKDGRKGEIRRNKCIDIWTRTIMSCCVPVSSLL